MTPTPKHVLDDICNYVSKENWSMTTAMEWHKLLKPHGIETKPAWLFKEVRDHYTVANNKEYSQLFGVFGPEPLHKDAEHKLCENKYHEVIFLGREYLPHHELESLDCYYCPTCNAFWKEP